jgi:hypothetical protein
MHPINLNVTDDVYEKISNKYGEDAVSDFVMVALEEFMSWLLAEERPTSISELETNRIFSIYDRILRDILPTAEDVGLAFNLPMGRSRYIVQNLNYRHPEFIRKRLILSILVAFERGEVSSDKLPVARIARETVPYLTSIMTELQLAGKVASIPSYKYLPDTVRVEIGIGDKEPLLQCLKEELKRLRQ